ncbi:hypothetical protein TALC_00367 [Thermoplasmatales archaeon BRNA1]|nr:hypothetical protein TALC_00367 [Thermoplasmatales archaeon BRNA1]
MDFMEDLRLLSVDTHPNSISVVFRAFVETFTKWFCDRNCTKNTTKLDKRLTDIADLLLREGLISDDCRKSIKAVLTQSDNVLNFNEELNQFGHNYELNPTADALIQVFNSVKCLIAGMFAFEMSAAKE